MAPKMFILVIIREEAEFKWAQSSCQYFDSVIVATLQHTDCMIRGKLIDLSALMAIFKKMEIKN